MFAPLVAESISFSDTGQKVILFWFPPVLYQRKPRPAGCQEISQEARLQ